MSSLINKIKQKTGGDSKQSSERGDEQQFSIQPHPAKTNNPNDLRNDQEPPQLGGGLNSNPEYSAFNTPGPYIPNDQVKNNIPPPASHDELMARSAELNQQ